MTKIKTLADIQKDVDDFAKKRDWDQFHTPKNLVMALCVEASELMEHFQWLEGATSHQLTPKTHQAVREEIADVQVYLARLADKLDIDIYQAVEEKMIKNKKNYPVNQCFGSAKKYTEYQKPSTD